MNRIPKIVIYIFILMFFLGCQPNENDGPGQSSSSTKEVDEAHLADGAKGFNTATPPPSPDLRGFNYDVYFIGAISETYLATTTSISDGLRDGIDYLNSNGGVNGGKFSYHFIGVRNYGEDLLKIYRDLIEEHDPYLIFLAVPVSQEFNSLINESKIPVLYFGVGGSRLESSEDEKDYLFWLTPYPDQQMAFALDEIWANWEELRPMGAFNEVKVGYLTWKEGQTSVALTPQAREYFQRKNFSLELEQAMPVSPNSSVTNFLLDAVADGVTIIFTDTISFGPAVLMNDLNSLGLSDFFVISGGQWMLGEDFSKYVRTSKQSSRIYFPLSTAGWSEVENPAIEKAIKIRKTYNRSEGDQTIGYLLSLGAVDIMEHVHHLIVEENDHGEVNSQIFMEYLEQLKGYSVMGGLFDVDYTRKMRVVNIMRLWSYSGSSGMIAVGNLKEVPTLPITEE